MPTEHPPREAEPAIGARVRDRGPSPLTPKRGPHASAPPADRSHRGPARLLHRHARHHYRQRRLALHGGGPGCRRRLAPMGRRRLRPRPGGLPARRGLRLRSSGCQDGLSHRSRGLRRSVRYLRPVPELHRSHCRQSGAGSRRRGRHSGLIGPAVGALRRRCGPCPGDRPMGRSGRYRLGCWTGRRGRPRLSHRVANRLLGQRARHRPGCPAHHDRGAGGALGCAIARCRCPRSDPVRSGSGMPDLRHHRMGGSTGPPRWQS